MSGTRLGGLRAAATNKQKYGENFYIEIGRRGGQNSHLGGFASMDKEKVRACGRKGGLASSRAGIKNGEGKRWQR